MNAEGPSNQGQPNPGDPIHIRAFTAGQRRAFVIFLSLFIACLAIALVRNPAHVDDPLPGIGPRYNELVDRLDPNTADVSALSALPQLGARRAKDIVDYRDRIRANDRNRIVFKNLEDLLRVRGMGAAMIEHVEPYLAFPATESTQPTTKKEPSP